MDQVITALEAAQRLGISRRRMQRLLQDGRVEGARRAGRVWLVPEPIRVSEGSSGPKNRFRNSQNP